MPENQPVTLSTTQNEAIRAELADIHSYLTTLPRTEISASDNPLPAINILAIRIAGCTARLPPRVDEANRLANEIQNIAHNELNRDYKRTSDFRLQLFPFELALDLIKAAADLHFGKGKHNLARHPGLFSRTFQHKKSIAKSLSCWCKEPKEIQGGQIARFLDSNNIPQEPIQAFLQGYQPPTPS